MPAGTTYSGSADPMWRYRQLERMGSVAQLMLQAAEARKQREMERMERRVQLAASAVAAGGDVSQPAIQSVLNEMRQAALKPGMRKEGLDKQADLLEATWNASANGPEAVAQRVQQSMQAELQDLYRSYAPPGSGVGPGRMAGQPPPAPAAALRQAVQSSPQGGAFVASMAGRSTPAARALFEEPEAQEPTEAERTRLALLQQAGIGPDDPRYAQSAEIALRVRPGARHPPVGRAAKAPPTPAEELKELRERFTKRADAAYKARLAAWKDQTSMLDPQSTEAKQKALEGRPKPPTGAPLAALKVQKLRRMGLNEEDLAAYEELLAQAAEEGDVAGAWAFIEKELELHGSAAGAGR